MEPATWCCRCRCRHALETPTPLARMHQPVRTLEVRMSDSSLLPVFVSTTPLRSILGLASPTMWSVQTQWRTGGKSHQGLRVFNQAAPTVGSTRRAMWSRQLQCTAIQAEEGRGAHALLRHSQQRRTASAGTQATRLAHAVQSFLPQQQQPRSCNRLDAAGCSPHSASVCRCGSRCVTCVRRTCIAAQVAQKACWTAGRAQACMLAPPLLD